MCFESKHVDLRVQRRYLHIFSNNEMFTSLQVNRSNIKVSTEEIKVRYGLENPI